MAKNKKKQNKKKNNQRKKNSSARPKMGLQHLVMGACAVTNPFCDEAVGSRWPDGSHTKSTCYDFKTLWPIDSNASGLGTTMFLPNLNYGRAYGTVVGTAATFVNAAPYGNVASVPDVSRYRLTSYGLRIFSTLPKMTASGVCNIRLFSPEVYATLTTVDISTIYADYAFDIPISRLIEKDVYINLLRLGPEAALWRLPDTSGALTTLPNIGWQIAMVSVNGAPASQSIAVLVECFYHYEIINADTSTLQLYALAPPPNNPVIRQAASSTAASVGNKIEGAAKFVDKLFTSAAGKYLAAGIGAYFGGSSGAQAAIGSQQMYAAIRDVD